MCILLNCYFLINLVYKYQVNNNKKTINNNNNQNSKVINNVFIKVEGFCVSFRDPQNRQNEEFHSRKPHKTLGF